MLSGIRGGGEAAGPAWEARRGLFRWASASMNRGSTHPTTTPFHPPFGHLLHGGEGRREGVSAVVFAENSSQNLG
jgi:hypothetical protein